MTPTRILVVDDEVGMRRAVERVLGSRYQVTATGSSHEAIEIASRTSPHLAILDIRMPELDGFELMARLKQRQPDLDVILMTGSVDDQDEKLVRAIRGAAFYFIQKPFDRDVLRTLVERCVELRTRREDNRRHVQRLERELAAARAFQQSLLPPSDATLPGATINCRLVPSSELGGDLYDYASNRRGQTALLIADVAGHGASAAMLTAVVKAAFRASEPDDFEPMAVADRVRIGVSAFGLERFVTLIAAKVCPDRQLLTYVNAGHPPGLIWNTEGRREWLGSTGPLLSPALAGLTGRRGVSWEIGEVPCKPGDHLLLYTDGLSEALDSSGDGTRLLAVVARHQDGGAGLVESLLGEVIPHGSAGSPEDDLTLLCATLT
jgi:phosphoserine phosphatase RsbU/P